jgi:hypothetical protein
MTTTAVEPHVTDVAEQTRFPKRKLVLSGRERCSRRGSGSKTDVFLRCRNAFADAGRRPDTASRRCRDYVKSWSVRDGIEPVVA